MLLLDAQWQHLSVTALKVKAGRPRTLDLCPGFATAAHNATIPATISPLLVSVSPCLPIILPHFLRSQVLTAGCQLSRYEPFNTLWRFDWPYSLRRACTIVTHNDFNYKGNVNSSFLQFVKEIWFRETLFELLFVANIKGDFKSRHLLSTEKLYHRVCFEYETYKR